MANREEIIRILNNNIPESRNLTTTELHAIVGELEKSSTLDPESVRKVFEQVTSRCDSLEAIDFSDLNSQLDRLKKKQ